MSANKNCIIRLSRYKNALYRFKDMGFVKVFSDNIADAVGVASAQVRKDFSLFGLTGKKKGGYIIDSLLETLSKILGKDKVQKVIIVGAGNIGLALMNYKGFEKEGVKVVSAFDIDPTRYKEKPPVAVYHIDKMSEFIKSERIKLAILAVPYEVAQGIVDKMIEAGIKGVLNFAPITLNVPVGAVVNNVNLELELENVIYFVNTGGK